MPTDLTVRPGDIDRAPILSENDIEGIGLLRRVLLNVHALARNRVVAMRNALPDCPDRVGVSIDEDTAAILKSDVFEVTGRSYVVLCGRLRRPGA